jgi:hypothetical protein
VLDIDIKGYRQTLQNKGKPRILLEGLSNAFDTHSTVVLVTFSQDAGWADLTVKDNDPDGFATLRDAWTLFAASNRREDPEARGRFGQGEKELIAIAVDGGMLTITSTKGAVTFTREGRKQEQTRTATGTVLEARLKLNKHEAEEFVSLVRAVIVPDDVVFKFNDTVVTRPEPVKTVRETLPTVIWNEEGDMVATRRQTNVELFEAGVGSSWIYELGIPVVEHDGRFHINVGQKVPLNSARDNVTPAYLRKLREIALNETHELLTSVDMKSAWVRDAKPNATKEALKSYLDEVYGEDAVIFDPSNPEASKRAIDNGWTVINGRQEDVDTWRRIKEHDLLKPAGQVIETGIPVSLDGIPPIGEEQWTIDMWHLANYTHRVGEFLLGFSPKVEFYNEPLAGPRAAAMWGNKTITFNLRVLGKRWPAEASQVSIDELLIHEFAHHYAADHLSDDYNRWTCRLGAKLRSCTTRIEDLR